MVAEEQRGGGREGRLSPVPHGDQQALAGRVPVAQSTRRAHLARAQPQAEESGLAGLQHVVGQPGVVSRVGVHRHHLGDQVAGLRGARHRVEERRAVGPQRRVQHPWRVVVAVAHQHAQARVGAERGRALVAGLQRQLEGAQLLVVEGALREHHPALRAHRHVAGHDGVGDAAVGSQVGIRGPDLGDGGAGRVVLSHVDHADSPIDISAAGSRRESAQFSGFRGPLGIPLRREEPMLRSVLANSGTPRLGCRTAVAGTK
nr:PREDICTED: uncharacterized protein LOC103550701 [Equus przewalskii]